MRWPLLASLIALVVGGCGLVWTVHPAPDAGAPTDARSSRDRTVPDAPAPDECADRPDGFECTPPAPRDERWICIGETCTRSSCGDGYADAVLAEECDDMNAVPGDGCDEDCRFSCHANADCVDAEWCNGDETCDRLSRRCVDGTYRPDGRECVVSGGAPGFCRAGFCAPDTCGDGSIDAGEECDDGNTDPGDGCDPDCAFSCAADADCASSGTVCSAGVCDVVRHVCDLVPRDTDGDGYTIGGSCGGPDCNDLDPTVNPGVAIDLCNFSDDDCDSMTDEDDPPMGCWTDADGDGHTDLPLVWMCVASCPAGYLPYPISDCYDSAADPVAADVHPDQTAYFPSPYTPRSGISSFDYDCDGVGVQQYPLPAACRVSMTGCAGDGFLDPVPFCGEIGSFVECRRSGTMCTPSFSTRVQGCR